MLAVRAGLPGAVDCPPETGALFVVALPIGRDEDLGLRARRVLGSVSCVAAEDTRVAKALFGRLGIPGSAVLVSYHDHNEETRSAKLLARIQGGQDIALISDAGTPLVSDPGYRLVRAVVEAGLPVVSVPGPCAAVAALAASGLPPNRFLVLGFLPRDSGARLRTLRGYREEPSTSVLYVAPHRAEAVLNDLLDLWGDRPAALARDLTKDRERWNRGTLSSIRHELLQEAEADAVRGELTLVVGGATAPSDHDAIRVDALIEAMVASDLPVSVVRDIVAKVYDRPRRWVYQRALATRQALSLGEDPDDSA